MSGAERKQFVEDTVSSIPPAAKIRVAIAHNIRERQFLRQLLKLSEQRTRVVEVAAVAAEVAR